MKMSEGKLVLRVVAAILLLAILAAVIPLFVHSSKIAADDTGWRSPTANVADNASGNGDGFEIAPTYAYADGAPGAASNENGAGDRHLYYDYGFSILSDANIEGIEVRLDWWLDSDTGTSSMSVDLSWDGGSSWTSAATDNVESTTEHTAYLGSSTDKWGHSWIPSEFFNSNFRARVTCNSDDPTRDFYLDWIPVKVYYAPVGHLEVTGGSTMAAGGSNVITITAKDTSGNVAVNYSGSKSLTFSGPGTAPGGQVPTVGGVNIGNPVSVTFTNGVSDNATTTTLVAYKAESTTVDVTDLSINSFGDPAYDLDLTVNAEAASRLDVTGTGTMTAGSSNVLTITAKDIYGNTATGYSGSKSLTFSGPGNAPGGQVPTVGGVIISNPVSVTFTNGVSDNATTTTLVAYKAESTTVDVTDLSINSFGDPAYDLDLTVNAEAASRLDVTGTGTMTAGSSNVLTITAKDIYGNTVTGYSGSKSLTFSGPGTAPGGQVPTVGGVNIGLPVSVTFTNGVSDNATTTTLVAYKAESTTVDVTDLSINSFGDPAYDLDLTVNAEAASRLDLTPHGGSAASGTAFTVTVTAYDNYTNISTGYTGTVHFSSTDNGTGVQLPSDYVFTTGDSGSRMFTNGVTLVTTGSRSVTVTDMANGALTDTQTWSVGAGAIDHYTVTSDSYIQQTSIAFTVTVIAYDAYGNVVTSNYPPPESVTMSSSPSTMIFDGNGNSIFGETGDNVKTLASGTFNIQAKDNTVADNVTITASSGSITSSSGPYTIEDFRCFIATAAYGTPMTSEIQVLRDFRDRYLVTNAPGRYFVSLYYKYSPPAARFIAHHDSLRAVVRGGLTPIIWSTTIALKATLVQKLAVLFSFLIAAIMTVVALIWIRRTIRSRPT